MLDKDCQSIQLRIAVSLATGYMHVQGADKGDLLCVKL